MAVAGLGRQAATGSFFLVCRRLVRLDGAVSLLPAVAERTLAVPTCAVTCLVSHGRASRRVFICFSYSSFYLPLVGFFCSSSSPPPSSSSDAAEAEGGDTFGALPSMGRRGPQRIGRRRMAGAGAPKAGDAVVGGPSGRRVRRGSVSAEVVHLSNKPCTVVAPSDVILCFFFRYFWLIRL